MKTSSLFTAVVTLTAFVISASASAISQKEVVERFVKMDVDGARLTPQGWRTADTLFTKPSEPLQAKVLVVIVRSYAVSTATGSTNTTEFYMGYEEVGRITASSLHFAPTNNRSMKEFGKYTVVLTKVQRTQGNSNETIQEENMPTEWRIDGAQPTAMHLTAEAAIQYVTQMRDKTTDLAIRRNATQTLAKLKPYL